jgi:hypothetical protein
MFTSAQVLSLLFPEKPESQAVTFTAREVASLVSAGDPRLDDVLAILHSMETTQMATLDQVLADVSAETTALDSINTLIVGLHQQLLEAFAGTTLPPAVQAKVDEIFAAARANKIKIAAALANNVSPAPAPTPVPTPTPDPTPTPAPDPNP